ncbi:MAG: hypothetical protein DMG30_18360 [Acidobacteria bacterium]|nr:MAG: hypothetical protein DMG30_18360 [Acidobacteriota bacterium]
MLLGLALRVIAMAQKGRLYTRATSAQTKLLLAALSFSPRFSELVLHSDDPFYNRRGILLRLSRCWHSQAAGDVRTCFGAG